MVWRVDLLYRFGISCHSAIQIHVGDMTSSNKLLCIWNDKLISLIEVHVGDITYLNNLVILPIRIGDNAYSKWMGDIYNQKLIQISDIHVWLLWICM